MLCKSCGSVNQKKFSAEMCIHFPGLKDIDRAAVWEFADVVVCLDCRAAEFAVPEEEHRQLAKGDAARQVNLELSLTFHREYSAECPVHIFWKTCSSFSP